MTDRISRVLDGVDRAADQTGRPFTDQQMSCLRLIAIGIAEVLVTDSPGSPVFPVSRAEPPEA